MNSTEKLNYINRVLGFYFEEPFEKDLELFPAPDNEIEQWYKFALIFEKVVERAGIPNEQFEILQLLIEEATSEHFAATFLGEEPDTDQELGVGYDGYDIPDGFANKHHALIWETIFEIYGS